MIAASAPALSTARAQRLARVGLPLDATLVSYAVDPDGRASAKARVHGEVVDVAPELAAFVWGQAEARV